MHSNRISIAISIAILSLQFNIAQGREIIRTGALSADVSDSFRCSENIELFVRAPHKSYFSGKNKELQKLVGGARAVLGFECSKINKIALVGTVGNARVYQGHSHKDQGWLVTKEKQKKRKPHDKVIARKKPTPRPSAKKPAVHPSPGRTARQVVKIPADRNSWTTKLIGTWTGKIRKEEVELALWIPKSKTPLSALPELNLYMQTTDGRCTYGDPNGHPAQAYSFDLPDNADLYDSTLLRYFIAPSIYNETREGQKYCSKNRDIYSFMLSYDHASDQLLAQPKGYRPGISNGPQWPLRRTTPSSKMARFLNDLERKYGRSFYSGQKQLLMNRDADFSTYKNNIPVSCLVAHRFALTQMYKHGISHLEAFPVPGNDTVEVKINRMSWNADGSFNRTRQANSSYPKNLDVDWAHLSMSYPQTQSETACQEAQATLSFLRVLSSSTTKQVAATSEVPKLQSINNYYMIDKNGVDQIRKSDSATLGNTYRKYGGNTIFAPGDHTRQFRWKGFAQKMVSQKYIKSQFNNKIVMDKVNQWDERKFAHSATLSRQLGATIFASTAGTYDDDICIEWRGSISRKNCSKHIKKGAKKITVYLTASEKAAIALFKKISPKDSQAGISSGQEKCPDGPFCELQAGDYLNAIYRGDYQKIREIDENALKGLHSTVKKLMFGDEKFYSILSALSKGADKTLLPLVVDEYMYRYQEWPKDHCLDSDAVVVEKKEYVPGYSIKDVYYSGMEIETYRSEGYTRHSTYIINREFWPTCQKVCGVQDSKGFKSFLDVAVNKENAMMGKLYRGLRSLRGKYDCRSKEIQIFEDNLIHLNRYRQSLYSSNKSQLSSW